jgi:acyl-CoA thioesterase-1
VFGDSISQGYGLDIYGDYYQQITPGQTYAELLQKRLFSENYNEFAPITVINGSLGGEFTIEALYRLPILLAYYRPTHVILAHGTNDAGSDLSNSYISGNLSAMVSMVKNSGAKAMLADVTYTRYGSDFAAANSKMYSSTASQTGATYIPILDGVKGDSKYYLSDNFHLTDAAQPIMMQNIWNKLIPLF